MQFLVQGYDGTDAGAYQRRQDARGKHLQNIKETREKKQILFAAAMLNEEGKMCGSTLFLEFNSREDLDRWIEKEPYVLGEVWKKIEVTECQIPASFL